jgi:hypothetical protein
MAWRAAPEGGLSAAVLAVVGRLHDFEHLGHAHAVELGVNPGDKMTTETV